MRTTRLSRIRGHLKRLGCLGGEDIDADTRDQRRGVVRIYDTQVQAHYSLDDAEIALEKAMVWQGQSGYEAAWAALATIREVQP